MLRLELEAEVAEPPGRGRRAACPRPPPRAGCWTIAARPRRRAAAADADLGDRPARPADGRRCRRPPRRRRRRRRRPSADATEDEPARLTVRPRRLSCAPCPIASRRPVRRSCASTRSASATARSAPGWPVRPTHPTAGGWRSCGSPTTRASSASATSPRPPVRRRIRRSRASGRPSPAPCPGSSSRTPAGSSCGSAGSPRPTTRPGRGARRWRSGRPSGSSRRGPRRCAHNELAETVLAAFRRAVEGLHRP